MTECPGKRDENPLADATQQRQALVPNGRHKPFEQSLADRGLAPLTATGVEVLQVNMGRRCNQACRHCHVEAGPDRTEMMGGEAVDACLQVLAENEIPTLDVTGGAPEMNPHFKRLVGEARRLGSHVIDRCNLTILTAKGYEDLAPYLAEQGVEIVASLPCYLSENTDAQRGGGVFAKSIEVLGQLNRLGYGQPDTGLTLTLVYNPLGASMPPSQEALAADYRRELFDRYRVTFTRLFTIANVPIGRFLSDLLRTDRYDRYMRDLVEALNPAAASGVMCRTTVSVDHTGRLFDCDFNQMLGLPVETRASQDVRQFDLSALSRRRIRTGQHCYACTAGAGSSCQGAIL